MPNAHSVDAPAPAVTSHGAGVVVEPFIVTVNHGDTRRSRTVDTPMGTVTGSMGEGVCEPFLIAYYGTQNISGAGEPVPTVTARDRFGLVEAEVTHYRLDIRFRMLQPRAGPRTGLPRRIRIYRLARGRSEADWHGQGACYGGAAVKQPRFRDQRKPGHFWADNELFDTFGPRIGMHGIVVYMVLARSCRGYQARMSLREIAKMACTSKDSAMRALDVLIAAGLIHRHTSGRERTASDYSLVDLKELAQSVSQRDRLDTNLSQGKDSFEQETVSPQGQTVSEGDRSAKYPKNPPSVSHGDSFAGSEPNRPFTDATELSQGETKLSHPSTDIKNKKENYKTKSPIPTLPVGKGETTNAKDHEENTAPSSLDAEVEDPEQRRAKRQALVERLEQRVREINATLPGQDAPAPKPDSDRDIFDRLKLRLKSDFESIPQHVAKRFPGVGASQYGETKPYDACFRDWWLISAETDDLNATVWITEAARPEVTQAGLKRFEKRIAGHLRSLCGRAPQIVVRRREEVA